MERHQRGRWPQVGVALVKRSRVGFLRNSLQETTAAHFSVRSFAWVSLQDLCQTRSRLVLGSYCIHLNGWFHKKNKVLDDRLGLLSYLGVNGSYFMLKMFFWLLLWQLCKKQPANDDVPQLVADSCCYAHNTVRQRIHTHGQNKHSDTPSQFDYVDAEDVGPICVTG